MVLETALAVGLGFTGGAVAQALSAKSGSLKTSNAKDQQATKTATPVDQLSEAAKRNRQRAASFNPRGFAPPTLGTPGLLGA